MKISGVRAVYAIVVLCGIVYAFIVLRGPNGIPGLLEKKHQVRVTEQENVQLQREIERKQERIRLLRDNPAQQEFEIRQRLKLARPGERVYIIDDKSK